MDFNDSIALIRTVGDIKEALSKIYNSMNVKIKDNKSGRFTDPTFAVEKMIDQATGKEIYYLELRQ